MQSLAGRIGGIVIDAFHGAGVMALLIKEVPPSNAPMDLLLLADPSVEKINGYLPASRCFVAYVGEVVVGVCVLTFLSILHQLASMKVAQFVIATHSPILLTLPGATVLSIEDGQIREVDYRKTEHFQLTRDFLNAPERYHRHLFRSEDDSQDVE